MTATVTPAPDAYIQAPGTFNVFRCHCSARTASPVGASGAAQAGADETPTATKPASTAAVTRMHSRPPFSNVHRRTPAGARAGRDGPGGHSTLRSLDGTAILTGGQQCEEITPNRRVVAGDGRSDCEDRPVDGSERRQVCELDQTHSFTPGDKAATPWW